MGGVYERQHYRESKGREGYQRIHAGQRKLLMSEIEFLTVMLQKFQKAGDTREVVVVYAGAAPGGHTPLLKEMFGTVKHWILYDPRRFHPHVLDLHRAGVFNVYQEFFTRRSAQHLAARYQPQRYNLLFVCDIRRDAQNDAAIAQDMDDQQTWCVDTKAAASILKFRLPYPRPTDSEGSPGDPRKYLGGTVYLPVWGPRNTTECRLIVNRRVFAEDVDKFAETYSCKKVEEQMCFFNNQWREKRHYDVQAQRYIIQHYIGARLTCAPRYTESELLQRIAAVCRDEAKFPPRCDVPLDTEDIPPPQKRCRRA